MVFLQVRDDFFFNSCAPFHRYQRLNQIFNIFWQSSHKAGRYKNPLPLRTPLTPPHSTRECDVVMPHKRRLLLSTMAFVHAISHSLVTRVIVRRHSACQTNNSLATTAMALYTALWDAMVGEVNGTALLATAWTYQTSPRCAMQTGCVLYHRSVLAS